MRKIINFSLLNLLKFIWCFLITFNGYVTIAFLDLLWSINDYALCSDDSRKFSSHCQIFKKKTQFKNKKILYLKKKKGHCFPYTKWQFKNNSFNLWCKFNCLKLIFTFVLTIDQWPKMGKSYWYDIFASIYIILFRWKNCWCVELQMIVFINL